MRNLKLSLLIGFLFFCLSSKADSPLTSTAFAEVYQNEEIVKKALSANGCMSIEMMDYLANEDNPVGVKIALVNALGWNFECNSPNYEMFLGYLKKEYGLSSEIELLSRLDGSVLASLAYIKALGNYFEVYEAYLIANVAKMVAPESLSVNMVFALICAQINMDNDWCDVYSVCNDVVQNTELVQDLKKEAVDKIMEYINGYSEYCVKTTILEIVDDNTCE